MENRAKERLTGAVILVALIVLLVPELFSGRSRAPVSGAAGTEQAPLSSYTFGLGDDSRGGPGHGPGAMLTSASEAASAAPASSGAASMPPVPSPHPAAASAASSAAASVMSSAPSVGKSAPSGHATASQAVPGAAPAAAAPARRSAHATHVAGSNGWWVQVGSFSSRANAERLVQRLKSEGFNALSVEGSQSGRKWYRVRVGPQHSHAAAQAVAARLHADGHTGSVVPQS